MSFEGNVVKVEVRGMFWSTMVLVETAIL